MKERLDKILFDLGYFETKNKAQAAIMAGNVKINGEKITKAGYLTEYNDNMMIDVQSMPFVSRGGYKLAKAVKEFNLDLKDRVCLDAGASTGGFTDCMLQNGAKKVYSVDVGYGQLAWKLRTDSRVKVVERINVKKCFDYEIYDPNDERPDFCATDLSFISVTKVLENIRTLIKPENIQIVTLIKPQFEAGKEEVGKNGVVRDKDIHIKVINKVISYAEEIGLYALNLTESPIKGPAGNIEYLLLLSDNNTLKTDFDIDKIAATAFEKLN
ncbi:MAG: TlyA family RNA methyltransferase [Candidatus Gastranaerophilales bacterium]|nr:TlyA family RNA methyltransferase [Candidatus Gastranaerophilales bacterium]